MAKFRLLSDAYLSQTPDEVQQIHLAGTEFEVQSDEKGCYVEGRNKKRVKFIPGPHMEPLDAAAKKAFADYEENGAPLDMAKVKENNMGFILPTGLEKAHVAATANS